MVAQVLRTTARSEQAALTMALWASRWDSFKRTAVATQHAYHPRRAFGTSSY